METRSTEAFLRFDLRRARKAKPPWGAQGGSASKRRREVSRLRRP